MAPDAVRVSNAFRRHHAQNAVKSTDRVAGLSWPLMELYGLHARQQKTRY